MRLAVLADVHGNGEALRAVLADLDALGGADRLLVLGDVVLLGPQPGEVVRWLMERDAVGVYGNTDRVLLQADWRTVEPCDEEERADRSLCLWTLQCLTPQGEAWLRMLPFQQKLSIDGERLMLVHASPGGEADAITAETPHDVIGEMVADLETDLLLFGHTHHTLDRTVAGVRLVNPGAVGFPQCEQATARYALLDWDGDWCVDFRTVPYDIDLTVARLLAAQRPYRQWVVDTLRRARHMPVETLD